MYNSGEKRGVNVAQHAIYEYESRVEIRGWANLDIVTSVFIDSWDREMGSLISDLVIQKRSTQVGGKGFEHKVY